MRADTLLIGLASLLGVVGIVLAICSFPRKRWRGVCPHCRCRIVMPVLTCPRCRTDLSASKYHLVLGTSRAMYREAKREVFKAAVVLILLAALALALGILSHLDPSLLTF